MSSEITPLQPLRKEAIDEVEATEFMTNVTIEFIDDSEDPPEQSEARS